MLPQRMRLPLTDMSSLGSGSQSQNINCYPRHTDHTAVSSPALCQHVRLPLRQVPVPPVREGVLGRAVPLRGPAQVPDGPDAGAEPELDARAVPAQAGAPILLCPGLCAPLRTLCWRDMAVG